MVVPYDAISLLGLPDGPLHGPAQVVLGLVLPIADLALVLPLISALHVHAVNDARQGRRPEIGPVTRRGLATLPVVSAAAFVSWLGIMAGLIALIIPGVLLFLRWSVVAQAAALGDKGWRGALRRSRLLTSDHYPHVFALFVLVVLISAIPGGLLFLAFGKDMTVVSFLLRTAVSVATSSFTALATALLYFDLTVRLSLAVTAPGDPSIPAEDRPPGWYVDPDAPWRMRYWAADGEPGWSKHTAKTPRRTPAERRDLRWIR
ncbi:MAG: hypothetical protein JSU06_10845 [Actinobacteria bacterium]|nr:hypothetical protein [Actinomycetota bacterium]